MSAKRVTWRIRPLESVADPYADRDVDVRFYRTDKPGQWTTRFTISAQCLRMGVWLGDIAEEAAAASLRGSA